MRSSVAGNRPALADCLRTPARAHACARLSQTVRCSAATVGAPTQRRQEIRTPGDDGVIVVGAGIGGLASAAALHKVGIPAVVLERSEMLREEGAAIGMWTNAFRALDAIGLAEPCRAAHPVNTRLRILRDTGTKLREFGVDESHGGPHEIRPVFRSGLLKALEAGVASERIHFGVKVVDARSDADGASVTLDDGQVLRARAVIGADGVRSVVGRSLSIPAPNYAGYIAYRGVARFEEGLPVPAQTISMVFGSGGRRAGMIPLDDQHVYWFTTANRPASDPLLKDPAACKADAMDIVCGWHWGVADVIRRTDAAGVSRARIMDRWMVPGRPVGAGALSLVGDALHPCTPNLGQGGCLALEDAVVLARALRKVAGGSGAGAGGGGLRSATTTAVAEALRGFERERSVRAARIAAQSWLFGFVLQMPFAPAVAARDFYVKNLLSPKHFLSHTLFDVGSL